MTLDRLLDQFYAENGIPENGGADKDSFQINVFGINATMPNPTFRKEVIHIHDIQHILNKCDTSWKGEAFIAGWEISTGMWKYFPLALLSLWAMGYSFWLYPKAVFQGFKKGLNDIGIIELKLDKAALLKLEFDELVRITRKPQLVKMGSIQWIQFFYWVMVSQLVLLAPFLAILAGLF